MTIAEKTLYLIAVGQTIRTRHWQTTSYAEHLALGGLYDDINAFTDALVETVQGSDTTRIQFPADATVPVTNVGAEDVQDLLVGFVAFLREPLLDGLEGSEFANMRDDLLSKVQKARYLLSLL